MATLVEGGLVFLFLWLIRCFGLLIEVKTILLAVMALVALEGFYFHPYLKRFQENRIK